MLCVDGGSVVLTEAWYGAVVTVRDKAGFQVQRQVAAGIADVEVAQGQLTNAVGRGEGRVFDFFPWKGAAARR